LSARRRARGFDRHPRLKIILGHLGENLPCGMWRIDNRNAWSNAPHRCPAKKKMAEYFRDNFYLTASGNFRTQTMVNAMLEIGADRVLFSVDYPFESCADAAGFDAPPSANRTASRSAAPMRCGCSGCKTARGRRPLPAPPVAS
jgi:predicted TIM-barrel fold metal-dependent hydrolase